MKNEACWECGIESLPASHREDGEPGRNQKGWNEIKGKWNILRENTLAEMIDAILHKNDIVTICLKLSTFDTGVIFFISLSLTCSLNTT